VQINRKIMELLQIVKHKLGIFSLEEKLKKHVELEQSINLFKGEVYILAQDNAKYEVIANNNLRTIKTKGEERDFLIKAIDDKYNNYYSNYLDKIGDLKQKIEKAIKEKDALLKHEDLKDLVNRIYKEEGLKKTGKYQYKKYLEAGLGRKRETMPQISSANMDDVLMHFAGVAKVKKGKKKPSELKPSQMDFKEGKILTLIKDMNRVSGPYFISQDNYLVDGHHNWAADLEVAPNKQVPVYQINLSIKDLLKRANLLKVTTKKNADDNEIKKAIILVAEAYKEGKLTEDLFQKARERFKQYLTSDLIKGEEEEEQQEEQEEQEEQKNDSKDSNTPASKIKDKLLHDDDIRNMWQLKKDLEERKLIAKGQALSFFCPVYFAGQRIVEALLDRFDEHGEKLLFTLPIITDKKRINIGLKQMKSLDIKNPSQYLRKNDKGVVGLPIYSSLPGIEGVHNQKYEYIAKEFVQIGAFQIVPKEWLNQGDPINESYRFPGEDGYSPYWRIPSIEELKELRPDLAKNIKKGEDAEEEGEDLSKDAVQNLVPVREIANYAEMGTDILKAYQEGVYADTPSNKKKGRVGEPYSAPEGEEEEAKPRKTEVLRNEAPGWYTGKFKKDQIELFSPKQAGVPEAKEMKDFWNLIINGEFEDTFDSFTEASAYLKGKYKI